MEVNQQNSISDRSSQEFNVAKSVIVSHSKRRDLLRESPVGN